MSLDRPGPIISLLATVVALTTVVIGGIGLPTPASPVSAQIPPTPTPSPVPTFTEQYVDPFEGFSVTLPEGWVAHETGVRAPTLEADVQETDVHLKAEVSVYRLEQPEPVEEWLSGQVSDYGGSFITVLEQASVRLGTGTEGYQALIDWGPVTGIEIKEQWTGVVRDTQAFLIRVFGPSASFDPLLGTINDFAQSFTLEERQPPEPSPTDTLWLRGGAIPTLDPALYRGGSDGPTGAIFSGLVTLDRDLKVAPDIAETWEKAGNGTIITFHLRPDAVFHDGRPVTAHDFKYAWERAADPETASPTARTYLGDILGVKQKLDGQVTEIDGVEVLDELTLQVTIDAPKPYFLQKLTYPTAYVVDRANVESGENWTDNPNGTGPFRLEAWEKDEFLILVRNDSYYRDLPRLYQVIYRLFAGRPMMLYEQFEIDIVGVPLSDIDRIQDPASPLHPELRERRTFCTSYLAFNVTIPPFDDIKVRQAFALALDIDKELAVTLKGAAARASGFVPPGVPAHNTSLAPVPFDPGKAVSSLDESRYRGAEDLPPIVSFAGDRTMHWMWSKYLGVEIEAVSLPEPDDYHNRLDAKELPLWTADWCADFPDPQNFLEVLFHSDSAVNHSGYSNPVVDGLLERAAVEPDPEARVALYQEAERLVLDEWVAVPLWHYRDYALVRPHVQGYQLSPIGIPYLQYIYFER